MLEAKSKLLCSKIGSTDALKKVTNTAASISPVVTKIDHDDYTSLAKEFINDTITNAVALASRQSFSQEMVDATELFESNNHSSADNLSTKLPTSYEFNRSSALQSQSLSHNSLMCNLHKEEFKDATKLVQQGFDFDLDFLENKGSNVITSDLRKQSLYVKFDPLVGGDDKAAKSTLIGGISDMMDNYVHVRLPPVSNQRIREDENIVQCDLLCESPPKQAAMESVLDAPVLTPEEQYTTKDEHIIHVLKYSGADLDNLQKPLLQKISSLQAEVASFEAEVKSQQETISQMQVVLEEFEVTVVEMANKHNEEIKLKEENGKELTKENAKMLNHLESVEKAYLELLQRCEQMKEGIGNYKANEETYKKVILEYQTSQEMTRQRHDRFKATTEKDQQRFQSEHEAKEKELQSQNAGLKARCKFLENQSKSLQSQLDQKTKENQELTKICDELIEQQQPSH